MTFQDALASAKKDVDDRLRHFFEVKQQEAERISPHCAVLVDQLRAFTMRGGKRTRAFLVWVGSSCGKSRDVMHAMMAVEVFQSFALIHDDIMDEDTTRRGGPTIHVQVGVPMAILAGDLALVWADELMGEAIRLSLRAKRSNLIQNGITASPSAPRNDIPVWELYQRTKEEVILGQSLDVLAGAGLPSADRATINRYKTAWYTVIRPLQVGAAIAGADEKMLASFVPYGLAVGEAYQLRDDFLDGEIKEDVFLRTADKLQKQATRAVEKLNVSQSATILLTDFARFALTRPA